MHIILSLMLILCCGFFAAKNGAAQSIEDRFIQAGLVDVATIDPTIQVDLVNADARKNFFQEQFYHGLDKAYLQQAVASKLARAQHLLQKKHPQYSLQILDAARPRSVSRAMYAQVQGTRFAQYVAHPAKGSMHNYGVAVDLTIVDQNGQALDMGITPFTGNRLKLYWKYACQRLGKSLTHNQQKNRALLAETMQQAGFYPLAFEWWHFNGLSKEEARRRYPPIE